MSDHLKSYKRNHHDLFPSEIEEGKIIKEKNRQSKYLNKSKSLSKEMLRELKKESQYDDLQFEEINELNHKAIKEKGNLKAHKKRLKKLSEYDDFN